MLNLLRLAPGGKGISAPHVLIIVQNLPVPMDRRVWLECQALRGNGYEVSVICPKGPGDRRRSVLDGVRLYKYAGAPAGDGLVAYAIEFAYSWIRTALLTFAVWRRLPFTVMQACNPPDTFWLLARYWKRRGVRFVFDHHDLNPELFISRFGPPSTVRARLELAVLRWLERKTFETAEHVLSTNESYRSVAITRGGLAPEDVTVVRSGPDTREMRPVYPRGPIAKDRVFELAYLGIMGPQDNVDLVLDVMDELVHGRGRTDVHATLMGFGDCLQSLKQECHDRGLDPYVLFTGRADKTMISERLSSADVGLCPDLKTPLNDVSTHNKTMEYMAYALPCVTFDLQETEVSAQAAALYVPSGDVVAFADAVERLLDDPALRLRMALFARERATEELDWQPQAKAYVSAYNRLTGHRTVLTDAKEAAYVDLDDPQELRRFILDRSARPALSVDPRASLKAV